MTSPPLDYTEIVSRLQLVANVRRAGVERTAQFGFRADEEDATVTVNLLLIEGALALLADNARMRGALAEAESVLALVERPNVVDPVYGDEVEALGRRIGFGALMSSAQASWRRHAIIPGGEFVAGPCFATVIATLKTIRQALSGANHAS